MSVHIFARIYWVHDIRKGTEVADELPVLTRCGIEERFNTVRRLKPHSRFKWAGAGGKTPTCDTCLLLHWLDPEGTECMGDYYEDEY